MSYRIEYNPEKKIKTADHRFFLPITLLLLLCAIINGIYYCSGNLSDLREKLMPWTQAHVQTAVEEMREDIAEGQPVHEAVAAFCREMIGENAQLPIQ